MKKILILALVATCCLSGFAQEKKANTATTAAPAAAKAAVKQSPDKTAIIQTNGVCGMCRDRFMENVPFFKGVKDCKYDMATAKLAVTYDSKKTDVDAIRQGISKLGYSADAVKADADARAKLPACCRVDKEPGQGCGGHH
jgi:copper chaperone CopZ